VLLMKKLDIAALARQLGGLPVYGILAGSPAETAGVRYGDVVLAVDGKPTTSWDEYLAARRHSGPSIVLRLFRAGHELELVLELDVDFDVIGLLGVAPAGLVS
jgi:C-terminal processing protease CtpA/Prc